MVLWLLVGTSTAFGQTTSFTYQGRLTDGGTAANGNYDLQFGLWNSLSGGAQVGSPQTINTVAVSNGVFTVSLDFGANAFPGASRFLEIGARPAGSGSFTPLTPRQEITSTPYAVRSLNAASADSVPASGVPAGSGNYIQSNPSAQQAGANFNISGNGTAGGTLSGNVVNATTQYNLNGTKILSNAGDENLFVGVGTGAANTPGPNKGFANTFIGFEAGRANTLGSRNAFFGERAGFLITQGNNNAFFGGLAGLNMSFGFGNSFFGSGAGFSNTGGDQNTLIGSNADVVPGPIFNPTNATAIGANAQVTDSNALVLGSIKGINSATASTNVGIGTTAPKQRLHVAGQGVFTAATTTFDPGDGAGAAIRIGYDSGGDYGYINANVTGVAQKNLILQGSLSQGSVGIGTTGPLDRLHVLGDIRMGTSGTNGCLKRNDGFGIVGTCSSDLRFKRDITPFPSLLNKVTQLRPVHYYWRLAEFPQQHFGNTQAYGLVAQEVEQVLPELVSEDAQGYKQVDYSKLPLLLLQAVKEQQAQIQQQQEQLARAQALALRQQQQVDALKKLVCGSHRRSVVCR